MNADVQRLAQLASQKSKTHTHTHACAHIWGLAHLRGCAERICVVVLQPAAVVANLLVHKLLALGRPVLSCRAEQPKWRKPNRHKRERERERERENELVSVCVGG